VLLSFAVHLWLLSVVPPFVSALVEQDVLHRMQDVPITNVVLLPDDELKPKDEKKEEPEEKDPIMPDGQIVDIPPPKVEEGSRHAPSTSRTTRRFPKRRAH
jgi:hypothetical protein